MHRSAGDLECTTYSKLWASRRSAVKYTNSGSFFGAPNGLEWFVSTHVRPKVGTIHIYFVANITAQYSCYSYSILYSYTTNRPQNDLGNGLGLRSTLRVPVHKYNGISLLQPSWVGYFGPATFTFGSLQPLP